MADNNHKSGNCSQTVNIFKMHSFLDMQSADVLRLKDSSHAQLTCKIRANCLLKVLSKIAG